jgi:GGDEF domain-containing protein
MTGRSNANRKDRENEFTGSSGKSNLKHLGGEMFSTTHIFEREDFFRLLDLEIKRARRYQNFFSVMRFELHNSRNRGVRTRGKTLTSLVKLLRDEIRETDVIGQTKKNEIMIILPYCDSSGADFLNKRLNSLVEDFYFGKKGFEIMSGLISFPVQANDMTEIIDKLKATTQKKYTQGNELIRVSRL